VHPIGVIIACEIKCADGIWTRVKAVVSLILQPRGASSALSTTEILAGVRWRKICKSSRKRNQCVCNRGRKKCVAFTPDVSIFLIFMVYSLFVLFMADIPYIAVASNMKKADGILKSECRWVRRQTTASSMWIWFVLECLGFFGWQNGQSRDLWLMSMPRNEIYFLTDHSCVWAPRRGVLRQSCRSKNHWPLRQS